MDVGGADGVMTVEIPQHGKSKPYTQKIESTYLVSESTLLQKGSTVKVPRKFDVIHKKVSTCWDQPNNLNLSKT